MEWKEAVIGGRVRVRLPGDVEVVGRLLGRDTFGRRFITNMSATRRGEFRAVVELDDGTIVLAELSALAGRAD